MALNGSLTTYAMNKFMAKLFGKTNYTEPDPFYFAWHIATTLAGPCTLGTNTISTNHPIAAGANLIVGPSYSTTGGPVTDPTSEQHVVLSVSGSGPYAVTLTTNLGSNHLTGAYVAFDPGNDAANLIEPTGSNYARASLANATGNFPAPSGGETDSAGIIFWPSPSGTWGLATHAVALDAASSGIAWVYSVLASFVVIDSTIEVPKIAAGGFVARAKKPS